MPALPYMRFYPADYLADAAHLTATQHGIYMLLIMNYWQRGGPLPADDVRLAKIARCSMRDWKRNRDEIAHFFDVQENHWRHGRVDAELARVHAKSLKCQEAGRTSAQRRFNERSTDVQPTDTDTTVEAKASTFSGRASRRPPKKPLPADWWPKPFSAGTKCAEIITGWASGRTAAELEQFRAHHGSRANCFSDWQQAWATWVLNAPKFERANGAGNGRSEGDRTTAAATAAFGHPDTWSDERPL